MARSSSLIANRRTSFKRDFLAITIGAALSCRENRAPTHGDYYGQTPRGFGEIGGESDLFFGAKKRVLGTFA
jgi:hypothetical protein